MKLIKELKDGSFSEANLKIREASRAVLFDQNGLVPILYVSKGRYHKLPGGGIEKGESKEKALLREILEEVGAVGKIIEYRSKKNFNWGSNQKQISYCYLGKIISKSEPQFTELELIEEFELIWLTLDKAIEAFEKDKSETVEGKFIVDRDLAFLKAAQEMIARENLTFY